MPGLNESIERQLAQDNYQISTWQDATILSRFNGYRGTEPQPITAGVADIVSTALRIGAKTSSAMDITIGPLVNLWGFGPEKQPSMTPDARQRKRARWFGTFAAYRNRQGTAAAKKTLPDLYVDLFTVGEGYATDHLAALLEQRGITRYLVSVVGGVDPRFVAQPNSPGGWPYSTPPMKP